MLNQEQIKEILPHRDPFLLVDTIEELRAGEYAQGTYRVRGDEYFFKGHFPQMPVMPGVLILEAMAQVGAVAVLCLPENKGKIGYFGAADKVRWRQKVLPGDTLTMTLTIEKLRGPIGVGRGIAKVGDQVACEALLTFAIER